LSAFVVPPGGATMARAHGSVKCVLLPSLDGGRCARRREACEEQPVEIVAIGYALVWLTAGVDAVRRPEIEWAASGLRKRRWTGMLLLTGLIGLGTVGGALYFWRAFPLLRRGRR
jgi:hypothetical protein